MESDAPLWEALAEARHANNDALVASFRAQIVEHHLGFFINYARANAFASWNEDQVTEYLHEIVLVALAKVDAYDPTRGAKFVTHVKPYLQPVRWKLEGNAAPIRTGYETQRLHALIRRRQSEAMGEGIELSLEDLAAQLSEAHGKSIGIERVRRIVERPRVVSGDEVMPSTDDFTVFETVTDDLDIESALLEQEDRDATSQAVQEALASLDLTEIEAFIVAEVFMAEPRKVVGGEVVARGPLSDREVAQGFADPKVKPNDLRELEQGVRDLREALAEKLRFFLG